MKDIKFAVVREDPIIEETIIKKFNHKNILLIASGGCLALSLKSMFPEINFTLFDLNLAQINLVKKKIELLKNFNASSYSIFNIGCDSEEGLNSCGEFESLFRSFRFFINEFIMKKDKIEQIFLGEQSEANKIISDLTQNKYWPVVFDLYFSNSILTTMFGKDAVQHAKPDSYPNYFKNALEKGFKQQNFQSNYFLQHIFLGYYIHHKSSWPYYLAHPPLKNDFQFIHDSLLNIPVEQYDFISLSNIFDWTEEKQVIFYLNYLDKRMKKGAHVLFRQLNNDKEYASQLPGFTTEQELEKKIFSLDRSLFYEKITILTKV